MTSKLRTRSTDLSVLRSLLLSDESDLTNAETHKVIDYSDNNIQSESHYDTEGKGNLSYFKVDSSDLNVHRSIPKRKGLKEQSECDRNPFLVTRINTQHKQNSVIVGKDNSNTLHGKMSQEAGLTVYKSIHYNNIIHKEDHLQQKYRELANLLEKDLVDKTAAICDQSMSEARQLIQNSLAASRIISSFVTDCKSTKAISVSPSVIPHFPGLTTSKEAIHPPDREQLTVVTKCSESDVFRMYDTEPPVSDVINNNQSFHPPIRNTFTAIYGYGVSDKNFANSESENNIRERSSKRRTDHKLNNDHPFIQNWLHSKDREMKEEKRHEEQAKRIEVSVSLNAERVLKQRKAASDEAFKIWCRKKSHSFIKDPSKECDNVVQESSDHSSDESLPQAGRQPRYVHNYVYRRPQSLTRMKTANTFCIRSDLKMKLRGEKVELSKAETTRLSTKSRPNLLENITINQQRPKTSMARVRQQVEVQYSTIVPKTFNRKSSLQRSKRKKRKSSSIKIKNTTDEDSYNCENTKPESVYSNDEDDEGDFKVEEVIGLDILSDDNKTGTRATRDFIDTVSSSIDSEIIFD